ncbi:MAG: hypothetical protein QNK04_22665 [Myxococcota bacterium]|nr:hypothetical protein [Myxococcota bacterium]
MPSTRATLPVHDERWILRTDGIVAFVADAAAAATGRRRTS